MKEKDQLWIKQHYPNTAKQVFTVAYCSLVDSSKVNPDIEHSYTRWFPVTDLPELGFDHSKIIQKGIEYLRQKIKKEPVGFELLPEKFTLTQLQKLYEAILGVSIDKRNFRRKVAQMKYVISLKEKSPVISQRPAQLYIFSKEVYYRTKKQNSSIMSY
jgi:8-oxo-dGTP diphosphatase